MPPDVQAHCFLARGNTEKLNDDVDGILGQPAKTAKAVRGQAPWGRAWLCRVQDPFQWWFFETPLASECDGVRGGSRHRCTRHESSAQATLLIRNVNRGGGVARRESTALATDSLVAGGRAGGGGVRRVVFVRARELTL
jgi:hypothetical protein